jgi:hypothetical protein
MGKFKENMERHTKKRRIARDTAKTFLIVLLLFLLACNGDKNGGEDEDETQEDPGFAFVETDLHFGVVQKGPAYKLGNINIHQVTADWKQTGDQFTALTADLGRYSVKGDATADYFDIFFEGYTYNELTGSEDYIALNSTVNATAKDKNINPLTTVGKMVAEPLFSDEFGTIDECLIEAEKRILAYIEKPDTGRRFSEMSLENDATHDAILTLFNSMVLYGRTAAEQGDYLVDIATGVINSDETLKTEILDTFQLLPVLTIKNNLESHYAEFELEMSVAPFWRLGFPTYYADLLERAESVVYSFNMSDNAGCSSDTPGYTTFAIPHVFDSSIDGSRYIALNFDGNISIWTHDFDVYDRPGTKVFDIEQLRETLLDPSMVYNGKLGTLSAGEYYIVIQRDSALTTGCEGGLLPFGRKLASNDGGANWIGFDNNTSWYRKSGVRMFTTD